MSLTNLSNEAIKKYSQRIILSRFRILNNNGFQSIGLGPRILRTETAPLYIMSAISYELEL